MALDVLSVLLILYYGWMDEWDAEFKPIFRSATVQIFFCIVQHPLPAPMMKSTTCVLLQLALFQWRVQGHLRFSQLHFPLFDIVSRMFSDTHRCTATPLFLVFKIDNFYSIRLLSDTFLFIFLGRLSCIHTFMYLLRILLVSFARKKIKYPITDHLPTPGSCPTHLLTRSYTLPAGRRFTSNNYSHPSAKTLI